MFLSWKNSTYKKDFPLIKSKFVTNEVTLVEGDTLALVGFTFILTSLTAITAMNFGLMKIIYSFSI